MSLVLVDFKDLEKIRKLNSLGKGSEGTIYQLKNSKELIKLYHMLDGKRKIYFDDLSSPNISFPKDILMYSNLIVGYTMEYLAGVKIIDGLSIDLKIEDLKQMYFEIRKIIENYDDIYMNDLCLENILVDYQNKKINLIDTSCWYPKNNSKEQNILWLDKCLVYVICRKHLGWMDGYRNKSQELFQLYRLYKLGYPVSFLEILEIVQSEIEQKNGTKVKTLGDLTLLR